MTLARIFHHNATIFPNKTAITLLDADLNPGSSITYAELNKKAGALAASLVKRNLKYQKVILLYPIGIDFVITYLACLYAGIIPIPVAPPDMKQWQRTSGMLNFVIQDAGTQIILTDHSIKQMLLDHHPRRPNIIDTTEYHNHTGFYLTDASAIAYIQYSSGTTGQPKGVMISHNNLIHSMRHNSINWHIDHHDLSLSRTPHFFIYGLITGILLPLYNANTNYLLLSSAAIKNPACWLRAISNYKITYSGCPNFGYQSCVDKINPAALPEINLSSWRIAICGGEFIQEKTLQNFYQKFAECSFRLESFCASYGMAEMTGYVSAARLGVKPKIYAVDKKALRINKILRNQRENNYAIVSCGRVSEHVEIKIINSSTLKETAVNEIGQICAAGPSLCMGYINNPGFADNIVSLENKLFFKTGDEGFIANDELYLVSRKKEIIVYQGEYYTPDEIESSAKRAHPALKNQTVMAVSVSFRHENQVLMMLEVAKDISVQQLKKLARLVRHAVYESCQMALHQIVFVKEGSLPRTQSGKLQRNAAREAYLAKELVVIARSVATKQSRYRGAIKFA